MKNQAPLVSICCMAFNHENYIRDAIEGFLMQETRFPFEIIIHDDASTDNTAQIIKEYEGKHPGLFVTIYQTENQYSQGVKPWINFVFPIIRSKYIALCEGDDYWTDPLKLQKQVDFLEGNEEYAGCFHDFLILKEETKEFIKREKPSLLKNDARGITFSSFLETKDWLTQTLTAVYRKKALEGIDFSNYQHSRDTHLFYHLLKEGKGFWMNEIMGVYRHHTGGVFSMQNHENNLDMSYLVFFELASQNKNDKTAINYFSSLSAYKLVNLLFRKNKSKFKFSKILKDNLNISFLVLVKTLLRFSFYLIKNIKPINRK